MNPPGWLVDRLPEWARSIRFRYTLLYSAVLFGLAAVVVAAIYLVLVMSLRGEPFATGVPEADLLRATSATSRSPSGSWSAWSTPRP